MNKDGIEALIDALASQAEPVQPLRAPWSRALVTVGLMTLIGGVAVALVASVNPFATGERGQWLAALEMMAMFATGVLGITAAFHLSVPGRSKTWIAAPIPPFVAWLLLSGIGCYRDFLTNGPDGMGLGHSVDCLLFIAAASLLVGGPLLWRLSRARPIDPLPVAFAAGLGAAALSALLLQFFHPFAVTFIDLAVHVAAILLVVGLASLLSRKTLRPA
jgi:hypothetical protein